MKYVGMNWQRPRGTPKQRTELETACELLRETVLVLLARRWTEIVGADEANRIRQTLNRAESFLVRHALKADSDDD